MEFIKDNWYKSKYNNYYKFDRIENNYYYFSEQIIDKIWGGGERVFLGFWWAFFVEIQLEEIQDYLPINHPDKLVIYHEPNNNISYLIILLKKLNIE